MGEGQVVADDKIELPQLDDNNGGSDSNNHYHEDSILVKQTRTRRLFTSAQLFSFSMMYLIAWAGMGVNMYYALLNGGPAAYVFNYLIVVIGVMAQAGCFAELASIVPIAGAQYYWTYQYAPKNIRRFFCWVQGWSTWLGYIACLTAGVNIAIIQLQTAIQLGNPNYVNGGWHTTVIILAWLVIMTIMNIWCFWFIPWFELTCGILNVCFFIITIVTLWVMSPRNPGSFMMTSGGLGGWDNSFISWNIGMLTQIWQFIGFECVIHMGEETKNATRSAPRAMFWAVLFNAVVGFIAIITYTICMPSVADMVAASNPFFYLFQRSTGSTAISTLLIAGQIIIQIGSNVATYSSTTRLTWAWARDGGFHQFFGLVSEKNHVPTRAVLLTCSLVGLLSLLNIGTGTYIALGAVTSLSSLALYFSYTVILSSVLYARLTGTYKTRAWSMGKMGLWVNIFAVVYTLYTIIWLPFPTMIPVTATNMNYCGPVYGVVLIGVISAWIVWGSKNWKGPNEDIVRMVVKAAMES